MIIVTTARSMSKTPTKDKFIKDLSDFHAQTNVKYSVIGRRSINDSELWARLNRGGTITIDKMDAVYAWMREFHEVDIGIQPPTKKDVL